MIEFQISRLRRARQKPGALKNTLNLDGQQKICIKLASVKIILNQFLLSNFKILPEC